MNKFILIAGTVFTITANAQSGADVLLNTLGGKSTANSPGPQNLNMSIQGEIRLDNPVSRLLFNDWSGQRGLSYETNAWVQQFFAGKFETFAHLKTAMAPSVEQVTSVNFKNSIQAAHLYSLYRLNLSQSFMNDWLKSMDEGSFSTSQAAFTLDEAVSTQSFDQWLADQKIQLTAEQEAIIRKIGHSRHPAWLSLNAMVMQRKGLAGEELLSKLGINSPFRPKLAMTVALAYARKNDLGNAAKVLKVYYEPWMNQSKDPTAKSRYSLEIARLLYQIGSVDGAIQYYQKIPKGSADFITAREELSWCWLRQGNIAELRGNLATLNSAVLSDQFRPESSLVKAISDLKICNYSQVEKDFDQFVKSNKEWAKKIDAAIQAPESATPRIVDDFSQLAIDSIKARTTEIAQLEELANRSVSAALPAVGQQKHWLNSIRDLKLALDFAKKRQAEEFRRQWKNDKLTLQESIRKMQFVKIELLSQVSQVESLTSKQAAPKEVMQAAKTKINEQGDHSFPFDGVVWPDELFKLRALTDGQCAGKL
jgi:tetratricopeptide (TPR) repeat protein